MINILFAAHVAFILAFDYLPDTVATAVAGALALGYALVVVSAWLRGRHLDLVRFLLPMALIALSWAIGSIHWQFQQTAFPPDAAFAARQASVFFSLLAMLAARESLSVPVLKMAIAAVSLSALVHAVAMPRETLNATLRLAPFSGGLHTSGYTIVANLLLLWNLHRNGNAGRLLTWGLGVVLLVLIWGNGVRTPLVVLLVYAMVEFGRRVSFSSLAALFLRLVAVLVGLAGLTWLVLGDVMQLSQFSSGRIANYAERFPILAARDLTATLFGSGPGTDLLQTSVWWWDYKDSHSDILKYLWEGGLVGLVGLLIWFAMLATYRRGPLLAATIGLAFSSLISNAILTRPNVAFLYFAMMAYTLARAEDLTTKSAHSRFDKLHPSPMPKDLTAIRFSQE